MARKPVPTYPLRLALEFVAAETRRNGYYSKTDAQRGGPGVVATADCLREFFSEDGPSKFGSIEEEDKKRALHAISWLTVLDNDAPYASESDFDRSLRMLPLGGYRTVENGYITKSDFGFVACVYNVMEQKAAYEKRKSEATKASSNSEFIGKIGSRGDFFVKLTQYRYIEDRGFYVFNICDRKGNLGVFFSDRAPESMGIDVDDCFLARMTPKKHSISSYHGGMETMFNRVEIKENVGSAS